MSNRKGKPFRLLLQIVSLPVFSDIVKDLLNGFYLITLFEAGIFFCHVDQLNIGQAQLSEIFQTSRVVKLSELHPVVVDQ